MGKDAYERLAEHLDGIPQGFPKTKSGVELRLLRKVFSEAEAEVASLMKLIPESPAEVAERLGRDPGEMAEFLEMMTSKGQLAGMGPKESRRYAAFPFLAGIHEFQLKRIDREYVELFEEYFEEAFAVEAGKDDPPQLRVFPVEQAIKAELTILPFEKVSNMAENAKAWVVTDCICRKEKKIAGAGCGATMNNCVAFSQDPTGFDIEYRGGRKVDKQEALALIKQAGEEGLVHCAWNVQENHFFICNCCPCCCLILRAVKKAPKFAAKSNYYARIKAGSCIGCGLCADDRCPMEAIKGRGESYEVIRDKCIGCGVCVVTCPSGALLLERKAEDEVDIPPQNMPTWTMEKARKTGRTLEGLI
jgi:ferredoxin